MLLYFSTSHWRIINYVDLSEEVPIIIPKKSYKYSLLEIVQSTKIYCNLRKFKNKFENSFKFSLSF